MFLHNGRALDRQKDPSVIFNDGDKLWLLPQISGG
jgi:molybdopterin converting factor small subunit